VLGILTPVDMRYYLAAIPAIAVFGAAGATAGWASSANWRALAVVLLAASVYVGVDAWWVTLGPR